MDNDRLVSYDPDIKVVLEGLKGFLGLSDLTLEIAEGLLRDVKDVKLHCFWWLTGRAYGRWVTLQLDFEPKSGGRIVKFYFSQENATRTSTHTCLDSNICNLDEALMALGVMVDSEDDE